MEDIGEQYLPLFLTIISFSPIANKKIMLTGD
jgi:hypothetical protein